ncbi:hypothetical protein H0O03_03070 [Candidatus Micrarchaeota archaeon]|nr:hypothetical protein [Candidatus Micrarchaeota archaeon]
MTERQPLFIKRIDLLVHPWYAPRAQRVHDWRKEVDNAARDKSRLLVVIKPPEDVATHGIRKNLIDYARTKLGSRLVEMEQPAEGVGKGVGEAVHSKCFFPKSGVRLTAYGEHANQCVAEALRRLMDELHSKDVRVKKATVRLDKSIGFDEGSPNPLGWNRVAFTPERLKRYKQPSSEPRNPAIARIIAQLHEQSQERKREIRKFARRERKE